MDTLIETQDFGIYRFAIFQEGDHYKGMISFPSGKKFTEVDTCLTRLHTTICMIGNKEA